jgi:hypothetical protein
MPKRIQSNKQATQGLVVLKDYCHKGFNVAWDQIDYDHQSSMTRVNM